MAKTLTSAEVIERCINTHAGRYTYEEAIYIDAKTKMEVTCPIHGAFWVAPSKHYGRGHGCPQCAGRSGKKLTEATFIERAVEVHGNKYGYDLVVGPKSRNKVDIECPDHGVFTQRVDQHLGGAGCPTCCYGSMQERTDKFITDCTAIHKGKYDYAEVNYLGTNRNVEIGCPIHGSFMQTPSSHRAGRGCPACANRGRGFNQDGEAILYYLRVDADNGKVLYKIGVTGKTITERYSPSELAKITVLFTTRYSIGRDAYNEEQRIINEHELDLYVGEKVLFSGNTELFTRDILNKDNKNDRK